MEIKVNALVDVEYLIRDTSIYLQLLETNSGEWLI